MCKCYISGTVSSQFKVLTSTSVILQKNINIDMLFLEFCKVIIFILFYEIQPSGNIGENTGLLTSVLPDKYGEETSFLDLSSEVNF